jgi:RimJ/RimL family protein N-acetyltransferase
MIFLETKRLLLRNICPEDAAIMFDYRNNEICARYQRGQTKDLPGIKALTERRRHDTLTTTDNAMVAVALKETNEMVGEIVVMPNDDCFSLGYTFHYAHHRNGYAFEALSCLIEYLHALQPDWEFISFTETENVPSQKLLLKLGYTDMGYIEKLDSQMYGKYLKE